MVRLIFPILLVILCNFSTAQTAAKSLTEHEKIEQLIMAVEQLEDAEFIRNGTAYKSSRAAEHLRNKLKKAGDRVKTARDFIVGIASSSYFSGNPYYIRFKDGRQITAKDFLERKLKEIEAK